MKTKAFLAIVFLCGSFGLAQAQTGISVGGHLCLPMSTLGTSAGTGFGLSLGFSYPYDEKYDIIGGLGFNSYAGKTLDIPGSGDAKFKWSGIPVSMGIRFKPENMVAGKVVFLEAKAGILNKRLKIPYIEISYSEDDFKDLFGHSGNSGFLAVGGGIMLGKGGVSVEYNMGSWQWLGLKAFYQFGGY